MAASRKLQGEIDRCLKKVTEGVETFEDIWTKVTHATNSNQKEKYEADLKKEIKKLQRLRDQIKTWQASAEVKDKSSLIEHRKLIETQMERFKGLERETKTKAYSKEGLGAATKLDPVQKERDECTRWLSNSIEQLNVQIDQFEAEMDSLTVKRKRDKDKSERLDQLKHWIEKHRFHIKKLETLLRMLDNNAVDIESVKKIRDDVEYYTESNQDPTFVENDFLYDDINMDSLEEMWSDVVGVTDGTTRGEESSETPTNSLHSGSSPSPLNNNHTPAAGDSHGDDTTTSSKSRANRRSVSRSVSEDSTTQKAKHGSGSAAKALQNSSQTSSSKATAASSAASSAPSAPSAGSSRSQSTPLAPAVGTGPAGGTAPNFAAVAAASQQPTASSVHILTTTTPASSSTTVSTSAPSAVSVPSSPAPAATSTAAAPPAQPPPAAPSPAAARQPATPAAQTPSTPQPPSQPPQTPQTAQVNGEKPSDPAALKSLSQQLQDRSSPADIGKSTAPTNEANIPVLLSVAPLGRVPMTKEHDYQYQMLQAAFYHMPHPSDSERLRSYLPRNPYPTPPYYPQVPPPGSDSIEFFLKLSVETLFFIFYYMEGTKAQYLAAKALKKQSWRFHTKYMMWFQRHEEPKVITDEFEQGTYVYFDFEKWSQRKKEGFKFEYKFLEDRDLN
ncbi:CCR4-NOT transcription complex subunit 3-like isoform X1 [Amphibalanus amphitrite]|uniref:CCR4-NOT transcription complex subunit 3-like isoform X1 n=1 Tax=Amphibalanus amphitrite TaxID=1232801 RepID=UPI001C90F80C|nr:CCR4-NOT transcription complex subunit 3-like isoform X1 [Amphibalanus amphitrite]